MIFLSFLLFLLSFGSYLNYLFYDLDKPTTPLDFGQKTLHEPTTTIAPTPKSHPGESQPVPNPSASSANGFPSAKGHLQQGEHKHCPIPTKQPEWSCFQIAPIEICKASVCNSNRDAFFIKNKRGTSKGSAVEINPIVQSRNPRNINIQILGKCFGSQITIQ